MTGSWLSSEIVPFLTGSAEFWLAWGELFLFLSIIIFIRDGFIFLL